MDLLEVESNFKFKSNNYKAIEKFKNYKLIKYKIGHTPYIECPDLFLKDFQEYLTNYNENKKE